MKRRTIITATSFVLFVLLATCVSTGAYAQSRSMADKGISALSHGIRFARMRVDGIPGTSSLNAQAASEGSRGPRGPRGPEGPRGVAGPRGPQGVAGPAGVAGSAGAPGAPGQPGQAGPTGSAGAAGPAGVAGSTGPQGSQGVTGPTGFVGIPGPSPSDIIEYGSGYPIVSSNAPGSTGDKAGDYDLTTAWASAVNDPAPTITVNLNSTYPISAVQLYWGDATPRTFHLETCADIAAVAIRSHAHRQVHPHAVRPNTSAAEYCESTGSQLAAPWTPITGTTYTNDTSLGNFITFPKFSTQYLRLVGTNTTGVSYVLDEAQVLSSAWW